MKIKNELYQLLEENGKEINYDVVGIEFNEFPTESIELSDAVEEDDPNFFIGVEGKKFYDAYATYEFLANNDCLV